VLPIGVPAGWSPPVETNPAPWLLALLTVSVGLPVFLVSSSSPVLQKWFSATGHPIASDPYVLYAASNVGSVLAILLYPAVIESHLTLGAQSWWWTVAYGLLVALTIVCGWFLWNSRATPGCDSGVDTVPGTKHGSPSTPLTCKRRLRWLLLSFVPSSSMLSVTTYISSDLAAVPLLWVIPLGIYLGSFVLVFARRRLVSHALLIRLLPIAIVALALAVAMRATHPIAWLMVLHLATFSIVAMVCHGELAQDRPPARHLTEFYLWMSMGGVLGGAFNALIAPLIFTQVAEYPLTLVLACLLGMRATRPRPTTLDFVLPLVLGLCVWVSITLARGLEWMSGAPPAAVFFGPAVGVCFLFSSRPVRFGLGIGVILLIAAFYQSGQRRVLHAERSFFGIHRVTVDGMSRFHVLFHGQTIHGMQSLPAARGGEQLTYYHRTGPIGQVITECPQAARQPVAVVGLGAGSLASYGQFGQSWTFYEIDPVVARIANDARYFTHLRDTPAKVNVVLGDARLTLSQAPDQQFGVIVLDAYSSDAIPVHLITLEALQLYLRKLASHGLLAFHISNLHLDLKLVLSNLARETTLVCLTQMDDRLSDAEKAQGKYASQWLVMAREAADVAPLAASHRWERCEGHANAGVWTDDSSSILDVFRWR